MKLYQVIILVVIVGFFVIVNNAVRSDGVEREELALLNELQEELYGYLPEATDPRGEVTRVTLKERLALQNERDDSDENWSYGEISLASNTNIRFALRRRHRDNLNRSGEYYGYHDHINNLAEVLGEGVNAIFANLFWLTELLSPDRNSPLGARINVKNLARYSSLGWSERYGVAVFPAVVTANNFHIYPEWFVRMWPDIFMLDENGERVSLVFEQAVSRREGLYWTNLTHPILNELKRQMATVLVLLGKHNDNLMGWKIDAESLYYPQGGNYLPKDTALTDYGHGAVQQFREWLQLRYENVNELNDAWGADFLSFNNVVPPKGSEISRASLDWHTYRVWALVEYVNDQYVVFKTLDPDRYSFSWVHDQGLWGKSLLTTGLSQYAYSYVGDGIHPTYIVRPGNLAYGAQYLEVLSSFGKPVLISEMGYHPRPWPPQFLRRQMYEALGLGVWGIGLCQWPPVGSGDLNWGIKGTPGAEEVRKVFAEFGSFDSYLQGMWPVEPNLRMFVSEPTWMFDGWLSFWEQIQRHFLMSHVPKLYVFDRQLTERSLTFPQMMVSIGNRIIRSDVHKELMDYVKEGGVLAICGEFFVYDETMKETGWSFEEFPKVEDKQEHGVRYQVYSAGKGEILKFEGPYDAGVTEALVSFSRQRGISLEPVKVEDSQGYPEIDIESFLLSDGVNYTVVLINVADVSVSAELSMEDYVLGSSTYNVVNLVDGTNVKTEFSSKDKTNISIAPYDTAVLYFARATHEGEVNRLISKVKSGWEDLSALGIEPWGKEIIEKAERDLENGRPDKALAGTNKVMNYLYVIPEKDRLAVTEGMRWPLPVKVFDYNGSPVSGVYIDTRITPGFDTRLLWREVGNGCYEILVDDLLVPPIYNYSREKYIRYQGICWLEVDVWLDGKEGYITVELEFK